VAHCQNMYGNFNPPCVQPIGPSPMVKHQTPLL